MKVNKWNTQQSHVELYKKQPAPMDKVFITKGVHLLRNYGLYTEIIYCVKFYRVNHYGVCMTSTIGLPWPELKGADGDDANRQTHLQICAKSFWH